jgi:hypothetical protein
MNLKLIIKITSKIKSMDIEIPKGIVSVIAGSILPDKNKENINIDNTDIEKNIEKKSIIVCIHKDISKKDINTLSLYGKVIFLEESYQNIDPSKLIFDYLIIDLRNEINRNYYKIYLYKNKNYYYILYRYSFEGNNGLYYHNEITDFPSKQSTKNMYERLLLFENVYEPNCCVSLCRICCLR